MIGDNQSEHGPAQMRAHSSAAAAERMRAHRTKALQVAVRGLIYQGVGRRWRWREIETDLWSISVHGAEL
jgi:hypothetical protein